MSLQSYSHGGASAPSTLAQAEHALALGLRLILSGLSSKKRARLLGQALEQAITNEQALKVRLLRVTGEANVRPLRGPSGEEVRQRQVQIDTLAMLIRSLDAELKMEGGA